MSDDLDIESPDHPGVHIDGWRELTTDERISLLPPETRASIYELTDICMAHTERKCVGGECDEGRRCERHERSVRVADRAARMRARRRAQLLAVALRLFDAKPLSVEEIEAFAELEAARKLENGRVEWALDRGMSIRYPGATWFGRCA